MKKQLPSAKLPLPRFQSDSEAAEYFGKHSVADVWEQLPVARQSKPSASLAKKVLERHARAKSPISIRLVPDQIEAAKRIAAAKSVGYQTQLRMWIAEGIQREGKVNRPATRKCPNTLRLAAAVISVRRRATPAKTSFEVYLNSKVE